MNDIRNHDKVSEMGSEIGLFLAFICRCILYLFFCSKGIFSLFLRIFGLVVKCTLTLNSEDTQSLSAWRVRVRCSTLCLIMALRLKRASWERWKAWPTRLRLTLRTTGRAPDEFAVDAEVATLTGDVEPTTRSGDDGLGAVAMGAMAARAFVVGATTRGALVAILGKGSSPSTREGWTERNPFCMSVRMKT